MSLGGLESEINISQNKPVNLCGVSSGLTSGSSRPRLGLLRVPVGLLVVSKAPTAGRLGEDEQRDGDDDEDDGDDDADDEADGAGLHVAVVVRPLDVDPHAFDLGALDHALLRVTPELEAIEIRLFGLYGSP